MGAFGRAGGGGRRTNPRGATSLLANLSTLSSLYQASLVDLSTTGARLRAGRLPDAGEAGTLQFGRLKLFGEVRWSCEGECGFEFFDPISPFQLTELLREYRLHKGDPDFHAAREYWNDERLR